MSQTDSAVLQHIRDRLDHMLQFPEFWGSEEALELQVLQLLEAHAIARNPQVDRARLFQDLQAAYRRFVGRISPRDNRLLSQRPNVDTAALVSWLSVFRIAWETGIAEPNPYEVHDVVLSLQFDDSVTLPPASMIGHYYETFRRVIRGIARPNQVGRTPRELELATEFVTPELRIIPRNGAPGRVVLPLELPAPAQQDLSIASPLAAVRDALSHVATVVEWANSSERVEKIASVLPQSEHRQRVASQTLRLLPGAHSLCNLVEFGGRALGRLSPMQLRPGLTPRLNEVVRYGQTAERFEMGGIIRKLDLDRGIIGVRPVGGGRRVDLWVTSEIEIEPTLLDATVRLVGDRYVDALGRRTLIVSTLDVTAYDAAESDEEPEVTLRTKK